ncbi:MAG: GAF domain-containing sensor histidine kinase [Chloroflexia bacterium]|nr:GAF domain-containing sensor histidine kinase [Chloroflexia bacterium]
MNTPRIVLVAWLMGALTVVLVAGSIGFAIVSGPRRDHLDYLPFLIACAIVGSVIVTRQPGNQVGWLLSGGALSFALMSFTGHYALYGLVTAPGSLPGARILSWPQTWLWVPGAVSIYLLLPLYFPNGHLVSSRWRLGSRFAVIAGIIVAIAASVIPGDDMIQARTGEGVIVNPLGIDGWAESSPLSPATLDTVMSVLSFVMLCIVAASLVARYRRSRDIERQQMKWLTYAIAGLPVFIVSGILYEPLKLAGGFFLAAIPVAVGIAILKYDLYDIDLIINRTLVYGALTGAVIGIYVLIVGYVGSLLRTDSSLPISLATTGIVAVLFQPLRERLQRGVNRLMYGERDEPYAVISRLGQRIEDTLTPDAVLPAIVETVAQALKLPYAAITLGSQSPVIAAASGTPVHNPVHLPLVYRNEPVGELILAPRAPGETFSPADRRLLNDLTRQAGIAAHAVRLSNELQHSRERLVTAREEERRRLRRDLHDGLGPALASMTLQAEAARDLVNADPVQADDVLADLTAGLQEATADIRRLVYGLRPPALDDLGLLPALRNQATRYGPGGPHITIVADEPMPALPAAVEVAAYRIIQEALANVVRHAQATICTIAISLTADHLKVDITDNGTRLPDTWESGVGLRSMRERAAELGGTCSVESLESGGTRIAASLPVWVGEQTS